MKKYIVFALFICGAAGILQSCGSEGPVGPQGPEGVPGADGLIAMIFEGNGNFTAANDYSIGYDFPNSVEVLESDAVLIYRASGQVPISGQDPAILWQPLPQIRTMGSGILQYNFDHTFFDVSIFLDGNVDFASLGAEWTQNQYFRIVIIPGDYVSARKATVDFNNYEEVARTFGLDEAKVVKLN